MHKASLTRCVQQPTAQVDRCAGPSGANREYVLELAQALRRLDVVDAHVFEIESLLLQAAS